MTVSTSAAMAEWTQKYGMSSRATCRTAQLELARTDERIWSLENDLGMPSVPFDREFPDRYRQIGTEVDLFPHLAWPPEVRLPACCWPVPYLPCS